MGQIKFNLNETVKVKLTAKGRNILVKHHNRFLETTKEEVKKMHPSDEEGYTEFQMWTLMQIFGNNVYMGQLEYPFDMNMIIVTKDNNELEHKFTGFQINESGEVKDLSFKEIEEFEKQGYVVELRLIRKEDVKSMGMTFEKVEEKV